MADATDPETCAHHERNDTNCTSSGSGSGQQTNPITASTSLATDFPDLYSSPEDSKESKDDENSDENHESENERSEDLQESEDERSEDQESSNEESESQESNSEESDEDQEDESENDSDDSDDIWSFTQMMRESIFRSLDTRRSQGRYRFPVAFRTTPPPSPRFSERSLSRSSSLLTLGEAHLPLRSEPRAEDWRPDPTSMEVFLQQVENSDDDDDDDDSEDSDTEDPIEEGKRDKELDERLKKAVVEANAKFDKEYGPAFFDINSGTDDEDDEEEDGDKNETRKAQSQPRRRRRRRLWFLHGWDEVWDVPDCKQFEWEEPLVYEIMKPSDMNILVLTRYLSQAKLTFYYDELKKMHAQWAGPKPLSRRRYSLRERMQTRYSLWDTTHIVTDMKDYEHVKSCIPARNLPGKIMVVSCEWLEETIQERKPIDPRPYALRKIKIVENNTTKVEDKDLTDNKDKAENAGGDMVEDTSGDKMEDTGGDKSGVGTEDTDFEGKKQSMDAQKRSLDQIEEVEEAERSCKKAREV
ncbi:hypothetical protein BGX26_012523 [Mortierella sp. AD094]|nr:hypothetical protein BGX26_012523 [Mortierella sp. AD094]